MTDPEPCTAVVTPGENGGLSVQLVVPTYEDEPARFELLAERDGEGDWRVYIPWAENVGKDGIGTVGEYEVSNGILYLGAPEDE